MTDPAHGHLEEQAHRESHAPMGAWYQHSSGDGHHHTDDDGDEEQGVPLPAALVEAAEAALEAMDNLALELDRAGGRESTTHLVRHFAAYHLADLQGKDGGWLGNGLMRDDLRELKEQGQLAQGDTDR